MLVLYNTVLWHSHTCKIYTLFRSFSRDPTGKQKGKWVMNDQTIKGTTRKQAPTGGFRDSWKWWEIHTLLFTKHPHCVFRIWQLWLTLMLKLLLSLILHSTLHFWKGSYFGKPLKTHRPLNRCCHRQRMSYCLNQTMNGLYTMNHH